MIFFVDWIERCGLLLCARGDGRFCGLLLLAAIGNYDFKIVMAMHIFGVRMKANVEVCFIQ